MGDIIMSRLIVDAISNSDERDFALVHTWVTFNGTGVVTIDNSLNVSSITDNGTGDYTINFTNSLDNLNYCPVGSCNVNDLEVTGRLMTLPVGGVKTVNSIRLATITTNNSKEDNKFIAVSITGGIN